MAQTVYDEVYDTNGALLSRTERIVPDPPPTATERIAALETQLAETRAALAAVGTAADFAAAKAAIGQRLDPGKQTKSNQ